MDETKFLRHACRMRKEGDMVCVMMHVKTLSNQDQKSWELQDSHSTAAARSSIPLGVA